MDGVAAGTMIMLGWLSIESLILLSISSLLVFIGSKVTRKQALTVSLLIGYCGIQFLIVQTLLDKGTGFWRDISLLGLSYYTCRHIHFLVESYAGRITATAREFWHYQFFWPVMVAGPIHRFGNFRKECQRRRWSSTNVSAGLDRIVTGGFKVVFLGNYLLATKAKEALGTIPDSSLSSLWLNSACDWAYLYFQFAGWSDIAIGFALTMGIRLEENFNRPYMARNLIEFWQRWHMTLSSWCKDYVFTPILAISRKPFPAVIMAMVVMGLWHEVSLYYLLWGGYHASGIACCRLFQNWKSANNISLFNSQPWTIFSWVLTMTYIVSGAPVISAIETSLMRVFT